MSKSNGNGRNQRNDPYQLDKLFVKFNHTRPGVASAVAHRTPPPSRPSPQCCGGC